MFLSRLLFFLALSAIVLGAKTGAASPVDPMLNPADVICGLSHGKDTPQYPDANDAQADTLSEALWKGAVQLAKSHGSTCPLRPHSSNHGGDCPLDNDGLCCPTGSSDGAISGKEADHFTQTTYGEAGVLYTATLTVSRQTLHLSRLIGPDPRPPAA